MPSEINTNQTIQRSRRGGKRPGAGRKRGVPPKANIRERNDIADMAKPYAAEALKTLIEIAKKGASESARVTAASALLDRGYGRPRQAVEVSGNPEQPIVVQVWHFGDKTVAF